MSRSKSSKQKKSQRRGAALIELAICLPVFFMITMATIEACRMIYLRQSLKIAAYECARLGVVQGMTMDDLQAQCDVILLGRNLRGYTLACTPSDPTSIQYGDLLTVNIQMSPEQNAIIGTWFYKNKMLSESVTIMGEF